MVEIDGPRVEEHDVDVEDDVEHCDDEELDGELSATSWLWRWLDAALVDFVLGAVGSLHRKKDVDCDRREHEDRTQDDHPHQGGVSVHLTTFGQHRWLRPYDAHLAVGYFG